MIYCMKENLSGLVGFKYTLNSAGFLSCDLLQLQITIKLCFGAGLHVLVCCVCVCVQCVCVCVQYVCVIPTNRTGAFTLLFVSTSLLDQQHMFFPEYVFWESRGWTKDWVSGEGARERSRGDGWWVGDWRKGWWVGVCRGRLAGCVYGCELGGGKGGGTCVCVRAVICIRVCMCLRACMCWSAGEPECVCVRSPACLRARACVCVFFCFALGCWVMGPAGRAEAIHFPSATLKGASREGGRKGVRGSKESNQEYVEGGGVMSYC